MKPNLIEAALIARQSAYAPYSGYTVGAAILDSDGNVWTGCNVENVSYGLCVCAERTAVCKMVSAGHLELTDIAISSRDGGMPCGMCLQTLLEFAPFPNAVEVAVVSDAGDIKSYSLGELIPHGFATGELKRT